MPVNLSIKNAPDDVVQRLRDRARRHHRSLQGELMAIIEAAAGVEAPGPEPKLSIDDFVAEVRKLGLMQRNEAEEIVRADRDDGHSR